MRILMVTAEYAPLAKTGGLGDAVASLAGALSARGHDVKVVMPLYGDVDRSRYDVGRVSGLPDIPLRQGRVLHQVRLHIWKDPAGPDVYLLENDTLYGRSGVYGYGATGEFNDTAARQAMLGAGALALPQLLSWAPHVVHVHDAASCLALVYLASWDVRDTLLADAGSMLTIHNLAHQAIHPRELFEDLDLPRKMAWHPGVMEFHDDLNFMKAGILLAGHVTTVSPTYAREVVGDPEYGCGLGGVLQGLGDRFSGVLNGMDRKDWNPATDPALPASFSAKDMTGKTICRAALLKECGLEDGGPVLGSVGRLVPQKGYDLLTESVDDLIADGWRIVVLGTGDADLSDALREAAGRHPGRLAFLDRFDEDLARRIYAGSDVFAMPSRFEPCGLAQMYAMRYGAVPVVRRTGGLADTVIDADKPGGTGFVFNTSTTGALTDCLVRAHAVWQDDKAWHKVLRAGMATDFSWDGPAAVYEQHYRKLGATRVHRPSGEGPTA